VSEAAWRANVHRAALHRWLNDLQFREELEITREDAAALARSELRGLMFKAAVVLAESTENLCPFVRLRAVNASAYRRGTELCCTAFWNQDIDIPSSFVEELVEP